MSLIAGSESGSKGCADGIGMAAAFYWPKAIRCDRNGRYAYVTDCGNNRIRQIDLKSNAVLTIAGNGSYSNSDGKSVAASLCSPYVLEFDNSDSSVQPDSVLIIACDKALRRMDLSSGSFRFALLFVTARCVVCAIRNTETARCDQVK